MKRVRENSLLAYYQGERSGFFNERELEVLGAFEKLGVATDREVQAALGYSEVAKCQPRISDLIADGVLEEVGTCKCALTGKSVRRVRIAPRERAVTPEPFQYQLL
jgi:hypothetical protein